MKFSTNFERLNNYPVHVPERLTIRNADETFHLRSIVAVTETEIIQSEKRHAIITGSTGLIMTHRNFDLNLYSQKYHLYDPFGASLPIKHPTDGGFFLNKPISYISPVFSQPSEATGGIANPSFHDRASRYGTIFIYAKPTGYNRNEIITI